MKTPCYLEKVLHRNTVLVLHMYTHTYWTHISFIFIPWYLRIERKGKTMVVTKTKIWLCADMRWNQRYCIEVYVIYSYVSSCIVVMWLLLMLLKFCFCFKCISNWTIFKGSILFMVFFFCRKWKHCSRRVEKKFSFWLKNNNKNWEKKVKIKRQIFYI